MPELKFKSEDDEKRLHDIVGRLTSTERRMYSLRRVHKRNRLMIIGAHYHHLSYGGDDVQLDYADMQRRRFVVNWVLVYVEKIVTLLTSSAPGHEVMSNSDADRDIQAARRCSNFLRWYHDKVNFVNILTEFVLFMLECGKGIIFCNFHTVRDLPSTSVISPYFFWRDLSVVSIEDAAWAGHAVYMHKNEFFARYDKNGELKKQLDPVDIGEGGMGAADESLHEADRGLSGTQETKDYFRVYFYFEKPTDPNDLSTGRYLIFLSNPFYYIIEEGDYPYDHAELPYCDLDDIVYAGRGWGQTHIQHIAPINQSINKKQSQHIEFDEMQLKARLLADDDAAISPRAMMSGMPEIILHKPGAKVSFMPQAQLPQGSFQVGEQLERQISFITGISEIDRGQMKSQTPWRALETMLDQARSKQGNLIVRFARMMSRLGRLTLSNTKQFMQEPKLIKVTGARQKVESAMFYDSDIPVDQQVKVDISSITNQSRAGMWEMVTGMLQMGLLSDPMTGAPDKELVFRLLNMASLEAMFTEKSDEQQKVAKMQIDTIKAGGRALPVFEMDDHEIQYKALKAEIQTQEFRSLPPQVQNALIALAKEHENRLILQRAEEPIRQTAAAMVAQQMGAMAAQRAMAAVAGQQGGQQGGGQVTGAQPGMPPQEQIPPPDALERAGMMI